LGEFAKHKPSIFYGATEQSGQRELAAFSDSARTALSPTGADFLAHGSFADWPSALEYLADKAGTSPLLVVLDEFPYLVRSEPALPSIIQKFWDQKGRQSKLMLIVCGSAHSVMSELQTEQAPMFGRFDLRLQLRPLSFSDAAMFVPDLERADKALAYGILGGMPGYLARWDDRASTRSNLRHLFADPSSTLVDEGEFVLSSELPEASGYFRILRAIAFGNRTYGAIRRFADIDIQRQLDRLLSIGLVERIVPVTDDIFRSKRAVYRIADNFLSFWFRFVYRARSDISRGLGNEVVDRLIVPGLDDYMGEKWEEMCLDFVRDLAAAGRLPVEVSKVGPWWNRDHSVQVDIVGLERKRVRLAGSVKWARTAGRRELLELRRAAESLPERSDDPTFALFAREKISDDVPGETLTFSVEDLLATQVDP